MRTIAGRNSHSARATYPPMESPTTSALAHPSASIRPATSSASISMVSDRVDGRVGLAEAAQIEGDAAADVRQALQLVEPQAVVEGEAVDEYRRRALARLAVEEHVPVDPGVGHRRISIDHERFGAESHTP